MRATAAERRHMDRVAELGCLRHPDRPATLHHVTSDGYQRLTRTHRRVVPLCPPCHLYQHDPHGSVEALGHAGFRIRYGIDLLKEAERLWEESCG